MTPEERMARAEALAADLGRFTFCPFNGLQAVDCQEVAAVLRGLIADLREARSDAGRIESTNWTLRQQLDGLQANLTDARRELAALRGQVVNALSAAGPGEDDRTA